MAKSQRVSGIRQPEKFERRTPALEKPQNHEPFQRGNNPMSLSEFERSKIIGEKMERAKARIKYTMGIQGVDGGCCSNEKYYEELS